MTDRTLDKFLSRAGANADTSVGDPSDEEIDDFGCFGWLRGSRETAVAVELRRKDGRILAIPYACIESLEFDPEDGVTLNALGKRIRIQGRNLNAEAQPQVRLFNGLARRRIPWLQEATRGDSLDARKSQPVIESLSW